MLAAAKSVAKMVSSDFENDDLLMIWRESRRGAALAKAQTKLFMAPQINPRPPLRQVE
jgi:hypothetical protein